MPWWALAVVPAAAVLAWLAAGMITQRAQAGRLPALADLTGVAAPIREAIVAADAQARRSTDGATVGALARVYHGSLRVNDALAIYPVAERLAPGDWTWTYLRALLLEERGDQAAARAALERVTAAAPAFGLAWYRLGELAFKQRRLDDAQTAYERARDATGVPPFTSPFAAPFKPAGVASRQTVPLSAYAGLGLARVALDRHDTAGAATRLRTLVDSSPRLARPVPCCALRNGARRLRPAQRRRHRRPIAPSMRRSCRPLILCSTPSWPSRVTATCCSSMPASPHGPAMWPGASSSCDGRCRSIRAI